MAERSKWPWVLYGATFLAALLFSPLTSARHVRVVGVPSSDQQRVGDILLKLEGKPWKLVDTRGLYSEIRQNPAVLDVNYENNLFGRGLLTVNYRKPSGRVEGSKNLYVDSYGQLFAISADEDTMPTVEIPEETQGVQTSVCTGFDLAGAGSACSMLGERLPAYAWQVTLDKRSVISAKMDGGVNVVLGTSEKLDQKLTRLASMLGQKPALRSAKEINLTVPNQPVYTP